MRYEQQKQIFLTKAKSRDLLARRLFRDAIRYEEKFGKDLSQFDNLELQKFLEENYGTEEVPLYRAVEIVRQYCVFLENKGMVSEKPSGAWKWIHADQVDEARATMYAGPLHLASVLDRVFSPLSENSVDLLYRCYLWLAFAEVPNNIVPLLRRADVDLLNRRVIINGESFRIYEEAAPVFAKVKELDAFKVVEYKGDAYIQRKYPEMFFSFKERGEYNPERKLKTMKIRLSDLSRETGATLNYSTVRSSGMFYRVFELERSMCIKSPDEALVPFDMRGSAKKNEGGADQRTRKNLLTRYEAWKKAFEV